MLSPTFLVLVMAVLANCQDPLQTYNIDRDGISVSGVSAGAIMASQMHGIYSKTFMGVGMIAGPPYHCSDGNITKALLTCMGDPSSIDVRALEKATNRYAQRQRIDRTINMANDRAYIFHGQLDTRVQPAAGPKVRDFYGRFMFCSHIKTEFSLEAQHGHPTDGYGTPCNEAASSVFLLDCGYSVAFEALNFIYGEDLEKPTANAALDGQLLMFDQSEFFRSGEDTTSTGLDTVGFIYVPPDCSSGNIDCKLHVALHGCKMTRDQIEDIFAMHGGYNQVADLNNIIILYPQAATTAQNGCFDWWGYTDEDFDTNRGVQPSIIKAMIDQITG